MADVNTVGMELWQTTARYNLLLAWVKAGFRPSLNSLRLIQFEKQDHLSRRAIQQAVVTEILYGLIKVVRSTKFLLQRSELVSKSGSSRSAPA